MTLIERLKIGTLGVDNLSPIASQGVSLCKPPPHLIHIAGLDPYRAMSQFTTQRIQLTQPATTIPALSCGIFCLLLPMTSHC